MMIYFPPKISVVMTVYNGERFLRETIESVLHQTFHNFEFIIVNDGSTDKTEKIIKKYLEQDMRIVYIKNPVNKGYDNLHNVVNMGLAVAKGKYIARLDADDVCYINRLQVEYEYLEKHPDIFLLGSSASIIDKDGNIIDMIIKRSYPPWLLKYRIAFSNPIIHSTVMFRNDGMKYDGRNEHLFYFMCLYFGKKIKNIPDVLVQYRINPNGLMAQYGDLKNNKYKEYYKLK